MARWHDVPDLKDYFKPDTRTSRKIASEEDKGVTHEIHTFQMGDQELPIFDSWAQEHARISGTPIRLWSLDVSASTIDPLYGEPTDLVFNGPFEMVGVVTFPDGLAEAREKGLRTEFNASLWIARQEFEMVNCPRPGEGDIVAFWDIPFYEGWSSATRDRPAGGYFFDVHQVADDGHLFDGPAFVGYTLEIRRSTTYAPERKLFGDNVGNC
jgi:hypothetical protein